jgi:hypothetical protein
MIQSGSCNGPSEETTPLAAIPPLEKPLCSSRSIQLHPITQAIRCAVRRRLLSRLRGWDFAFTPLGEATSKSASASGACWRETEPMATARRIRPRSRTTAAMSLDSGTTAATIADQPVLDVLASLDLPVLARLPETSPTRGSMSWTQRVDWLKRLDWNHVRRIRPDPNWIAGGVLSLVLVLLLIITLHRSSKPDASTSESTAPTWTGSEPHSTSRDIPDAKATASTSTAVSNVPGFSSGASPTVSATNPRSVNSGIDPRSNAAAGAQQPLSRNANTDSFSLEGVYYPQTPYAAPVVVPASAAMPNQQANFGPMAGEIRTAQRDTSFGRAAPQGGFQSARPQFDGIITQP